MSAAPVPGLGSLLQRRSRRVPLSSNTKAASSRPRRLKEARGNRYLYEINSRWTIDGTSRKNLARYANHSCRPNAKSHTVGHKIILRAIKNINPGDEITYSYGRDYFINVITRRGGKCDKCRGKRSDARAKARVRTRRRRSDSGTPRA